MTDETPDKPYPGIPGSNIAIVCSERVYSFFAAPDLRTLQVGKTYVMGVMDLADQPGRSEYTFYETDLDLSDASWTELIRSAQENGAFMWAVVVESNALTATGGTMVITSRIHKSDHRLQFVYDNTEGNMLVNPC